MGVVKRQTIKSVIYTYAGTLVGFITVGLLFPTYLSTSEIGVLNLVNRWSMTIMQLGTLGFAAAMIKYFPYFKDKEKKHNGFLFITLLVGVVGYLITSGILFMFNDQIIESERDKSPLFSKYFNYIYPVTFFYVFFYLLDVYSRVIYQSSAATLFREFIQRIIIASITCGIIFKIFGFDVFAILYFLTLCIPTVFLFLFLWMKKEIHLQPNFTVVRSEHRKGIVQRSIFGLISGMGVSGLLSIDTIMLNEFEGEAATGIYATVYYFPLLILIPARAFTRLAGNIVSECIKDNDMERLRKVYYDSCLTQFILGAILLGLMVVNIPNIFSLLKPEFTAAYYVVLIIGLGNLFEMATGINHAIIDNSPYYRFGTYFVGLLIILTIGLNWLFISFYGITGAAIGTGLALVLYNLVKTIFIYVKLKMMPFNLNFLWVLLIGCGLTAIIFYLPNADNLFLNIIYKSSVLFFPLAAIIYLGKFSQELNKHLDNAVKWIIPKK